MGRISQYSSRDGLNRGAWTSLEDKMLIDYVSIRGEGKWNNIARTTGLKRSGKSCRLRWMNYLRPDIKRGNISEDEEQLIVRLHKLLGNRWSLIAGRLPGRTDNEIKNYWNSTLAKKIQPFDFPLAKVTISNQSSTTPTPSTPKSTPASAGDGDWNQGLVEPTTSLSGDGEITPADYNMEDFLDATEDNSAKEKEEEKCWDEYYNIGDRFDDQFMDGSNFMSLVPFLDFHQVLEWSELA